MANKTSQQSEEKRKSARISSNADLDNLKSNPNKRKALELSNEAIKSLEFAKPAKKKQKQGPKTLEQLSKLAQGKTKMSTADTTRLKELRDEQAERIKKYKKGFKRGKYLSNTAVLLGDDFISIKEYTGEPHNITSYLDNADPGQNNSKIRVPYDIKKVESGFKATVGRVVGEKRYCICCDKEMERDEDEPDEWIPGKECLVPKWEAYTEKMVTTIITTNKTQESFEGLLKDMEDRTTERFTGLENDMETLNENQKALTEDNTKLLEETKEIRTLVEKKVARDDVVEVVKEIMGEEMDKMLQRNQETIQEIPTTEENNQSYSNVAQRQQYMENEPQDKVLEFGEKDMKDALDEWDWDVFMAAMLLVCPEDKCYTLAKERKAIPRTAFNVAGSMKTRKMLDIVKDDLNYFITITNRIPYYHDHFDDRFLFRSTGRKVVALKKAEMNENREIIVPTVEYDIIIEDLNEALKKIDINITVTKDMITIIKEVTEDRHKIWIPSQKIREEDAKGIKHKCYEIGFSETCELYREGILHQIQTKDRFFRKTGTGEKFTKQLSCLMNPVTTKYCRVRYGGCGRTNHDHHNCYAGNSSRNNQMARRERFAGRGRGRPFMGGRQS